MAIRTRKAKKTNKTRKNRIGTLRKGLLAKYGYQDVTSLSVVQRHTAINKAIRAYGALSVSRKLNAVYVYNRKTNPSAARIFKADRDYVLAKLH
jgi:Family of unknown function (DUF5771)